VTTHAPGLLTVYGLGPRTAALLLIAAGDHPGRLRSEAAWAHLCGVAPIPASSGKVTRHRLNPGGDRKANHALWRIAFTRLGSDPATRAYADSHADERKLHRRIDSGASPQRDEACACGLVSARGRAVAGGGSGRGPRQFTM
jgi:transposase